MITNANARPDAAQDLRPSCRRRPSPSRRPARSPLPFAVPQGANGDAYHMYPLFSGLGGYIFGTERRPAR